MSLLEAIKRKQNALKPTETIVTYPDGRRLVESSTVDTNTKILLPKKFGFVVDTKPDQIPACILDHFLYLGSQDAVTLDNVTAYKWTHILSVGIEAPEMQGTEVLFKFLPCLDIPETNLSALIGEGISFLKGVKRISGSVLVHCNAGVSRSASIVIAYLMIEMKMNFPDAYDFVKQKRPSVQPNSGFLMQLKLLDR